MVWREMSVEPFVDPFVTDAYIDISPPALRDATVAEPALRLSQRSVAQTDSDATLPGWVTRRRPLPLVYVTLGTVAFGAVDSLRAVIAGVSRLDVDVLVTVGPTGDAAHLGPLPPGVRAERFVPQVALLPHVDVAVHHCGSGTMLGSLAHGIPALAIPHGADQFMNADALRRSGAGTQLVPTRSPGTRSQLACEACSAIPRTECAARAIARDLGDAEPHEVVPICSALRWTAPRGRTPHRVTLSRRSAVPRGGRGASRSGRGGTRRQSRAAGTGAGRAPTCSRCRRGSGYRP